MRFTGLTIGIPLTLIQLGINPTVPITGPQIATNFALGHAVYDKDRLRADDSPILNMTTALAAVAATAYYASDPWTLPLAPMAAALHLSYTSSKPSFAAYKPFIVAACWTLQTYYAPLLHAHQLPTDILTPATIFLNIACLSHAADITDIDDDERRNIMTPAVVLGRTEAKHYAVALALAAALVHAASPIQFLEYDVLVLILITGVVFDNALLASWLLSLLAAGHVTNNLVDVMNTVLLSSETAHRWAIHAVTSAIKYAETLPPEQGKAVIAFALEAMQTGDRLGSEFLRLYEMVVRAHFL